MQNFIIHKPQEYPVSAVVFDTPHSGVVLPDHFSYACKAHELMRMHDPHVEKLLVDVPSAGSPVLEACIHRSCIDLNRYENEINPGMIEGTWPYELRKTIYTSEKFSLFPALAGPRGNRVSPIYNEAARLTVAEARYRIDTYHRPYYAALNDLLQESLTANGHAIHVNMHSFCRSGNSHVADIILGDGGDKGPLCDPRIRHFLKNHFESAGLIIDFNGPYFSGGALVHTTSDMKAGVHSIQVEIARDLYMNTDTLEYDLEKGLKMRGLIAQLAGKMAQGPVLPRGRP